MPELYTLEVQPREVTGKKTGALRRQGVIPGVVYGHGADARSIQVGERELLRFLSQLTGSALVQVQVEGEASSRPAIIREVQRHAITRRLTHIDFMQVNLTEKIRTNVTLVFSGEAPAVTDGKGVMIEGLQALEIECLPMQIPGEIVVDISNLKELDDEIKVSDIVVPEGVEVRTDADSMVARIVAERAEEVEEVAVTEEEKPEVEVITEKKAQERREQAEKEEKK